MKHFILLTLVVCSTATTNTKDSDTSDDTQYPVGDVRNCPSVSPITKKPLYRMEVLPGLGFDNLRNYDMSPVLQYNYSQCRISNDGRFLIPDYAVTTPTQRSESETFAEVYQHYDEFKSLTSATINGDWISSKINAKFSAEYQHVKDYQVKFKSNTTLVHIRNTLYKTVMEPDAPLNSNFKNRILQIAELIESNSTEEAAYLSELLVREYGTHVVRRIDAGALIAQIDSITQASIDAIDIRSGTLSASLNFAKKIKNSGGNITVDANTMNKYLDSQVQSLLISIGGPAIIGATTLDQWEADVLNGMLVATDRGGDPLHFVINRYTVPEVPTPTLRRLVDSIYMAIKRYYDINTHRGCTDPKSLNFDYEANMDDGSCTATPNDTFPFGGVFQTCQNINTGDDSVDPCSQLTKANPLTNDYTCPSGFEAIKLYEGTSTVASKIEHCDEQCTKTFFQHKCSCYTVIEEVTSVVSYETYWCYAADRDNVPVSTGYLFGGVYTSSITNPLTHSMTCPLHFVPLSIGRDIKVCVSDQHDAAQDFIKIPFGGFFSCKSGNPFSTTQGKSVDAVQCPKTYKRLLITVEEGCEISYCTKLPKKEQIEMTSKPPILPPFHARPSVKENVTNTLVIQGPNGDLWVKDNKGKWYEVKDEITTGEDVLKRLSKEGELPSDGSFSVDDQHHKGGLSAGQSAAISSVVTLVVCILILLGAFGIYWIVKRKKAKKGKVTESVTYNAYSTIVDDTNEDGGVTGGASE